MTWQEFGIIAALLIVPVWLVALVISLFKKRTKDGKPLQARGAIMVSTGFVFSVMNGSLLVAILIGWGVSLLFRGAWAFGIGLASTLLVLFAIRRRVTLWAAQKADAMVKRARERQAVAEGGWYGYAPLFEGHTLPIVGPPKEEPNPPEDGPILTVPAVTGMAMADAAQILNQLGLRVEQSGSGTVQTVNPAEGTEVIFGSIVRLHGDDPRGQ